MTLEQLIEKCLKEYGHKLHDQNRNITYYYSKKANSYKMRRVSIINNKIRYRKFKNLEDACSHISRFRSKDILIKDISESLFERQLETLLK